jgi:hypothetical protein
VRKNGSDRVDIMPIALSTTAVPTQAGRYADKPVTLALDVRAADVGAAKGPPRVRVADGGGEEFQEAARGVIAGGGDQGRHHGRAGCDGGQVGGNRLAIGNGPRFHVTATACSK